MKAGIVSLLEDVPNGTLEAMNKPTRILEINHEQSYLDGASYLEGQAAERTTEDEKRSQISGGGISVEKIREQKVLDTDFLADLDQQLLVIGSSDGEFLYNMVWAQTGANVKRAEIDVAEFVRTLRKRDGTKLEYWMAAKGGDLGAKIAYHMDADDGLARSANIGIGFEYVWDNSMLKGVIYQSGYVSLFEPQHWDSAAFLRWVTEELLAFTSYPEDEDEETEQTRLDAAADDEYKVDGEAFAEEVDEFLEDEEIDAERDVSVTDDEDDLEARAADGVSEGDEDDGVPSVERGDSGEDDTPVEDEATFENAVSFAEGLVERGETDPVPAADRASEEFEIDDRYEEILEAIDDGD